MKNAPLMKENIIWLFDFSPRKVGEGVIQKPVAIKDNIIWIFDFSPRKLGEGVIQKIKDDIMLANASHSLCAYSNLWARYHIFSRRWWKLLQKLTIINAMDMRKHVKEHFSSVGRGGKFISWGKSYVFQRRPSLSPNAQRTNCQTEQAKVELIFISVQLLRSKCFQRCLNVKKTYIGVFLLSSLWFT